MSAADYILLCSGVQKDANGRYQELEFTKRYFRREQSASEQNNRGTEDSEANCESTLKSRDKRKELKL